MTMQRISCWAQANRWAVAFWLVIFGGYLVGKDMAMRDNMADRAEMGER